eukprot:15364848-Ditylum_brightwellii.AAC.2
MSSAIPFAFVLSVMIGVSGCGCPISSRAVQSSSHLRAFAYSAPILASAADAMMFGAEEEVSPCPASCSWCTQVRGTTMNVEYHAAGMWGVPVDKLWH